METFVSVIHYCICLFLIIIILLQAGKGADIGAVFGGGGSQTVFGSKGPATILNKITIIVAFMFLITSIALAYFAKNSSVESVIQNSTILEQVEKTPTQPLDKNIPANQNPAGSK